MKRLPLLDQWLELIIPVFTGIKEELMMPEGNQVLLWVGLSDRIMTSVLSISIGGILLFIICYKIHSLVVWMLWRMFISQFVDEHCLRFHPRSVLMGFIPFNVMLQKGSVYLLPENCVKEYRDLKNCFHAVFAEMSLSTHYSSKCPPHALQGSLFIDC